MGLFFNVVLAVFAATGSFLFGYDSGVMTIVIASPNFLSFFNTSPETATIGAINATFSGGAVFGSFMLVKQLKGTCTDADNIQGRFYHGQSWSSENHYARSHHKSDWRYPTGGSSEFGHGPRWTHLSWMGCRRFEHVCTSLSIGVRPSKDERYESN